MASILSLHVYPVKSLGGISLARAEVSARGLEHDRRFMVVDGAGAFLTQRRLPRMSLVSVAIVGDALVLSAPGRAPLEVPLRPSGGERREVRVWDDRCEASSLGEGPARWLSTFLGVECALVHMPDAARRATHPAYGAPVPVSFADAFPFLLATTGSLAELARRGGGVPMQRFRPNLVVEGTEPFAEDRWRRLRIGGVAFRVAKPCVRCAVTTVDPATGAFSGPEPLAALATFRRTAEGGVTFGVNLAHEGRGTLAVGDRVEIEEEAPPPRR